MLWRKIIPAKQRINEIEEDLKRVYRNNSRLGSDSISVHDLDLSLSRSYLLPDRLKAT
jgi:hypothetical protein